MLYAFDSEIMENVFEWYPLCPCHMKKDMVASGDVYRFLEEYIGESLLADIYYGCSLVGT